MSGDAQSGGETWQPTKVRCDGCGELTGEPKQYDNGTKTATYCQRCERLRDHYDIHVADHEQYRLLDVADDLAQEGSA